MSMPIADSPPLLLQVYRLARTRELPEFVANTLDLLRSEMPFDSAVWGKASYRGGDGPTIVQLNTIDKPDDWLPAYNQIKHQDKFAQAAQHHSRGALIGRASRMFRGRDDEAFFNYTQRFGHANALAVFDRALGSRTYEEWISFYRQRDDKVFTPEHADWAQHYLPHLQEALAINQRLTLEGCKQDHGSGVRSHALAHPQGGIYYADPAFSELLLNESGSPKVQHLPEAVMAELIRNRRYVGRCLVIELERQGRQFLHLTGRAPRPIDQLTPRELQVALALSHGHSYKKIAAVNGVSPHTIRNQIRAIYSKLEVHNVPQLLNHL